MPSKRPSTPWEAKPHTVAKVTILKRYLQAWFNIFGRRAVGQDIFYLDAFAGPGRYRNHDEGSPIAALRAAMEVRSSSAASWKAGTIHCAFVEKDRHLFAHLQRHLAPMAGLSGIEVHLVQDTFESAVEKLRSSLPSMFDGSSPLMAFIDPFGVKGVPFSVVSDILAAPRAEVLMNLNADGIARILYGEDDANPSVILENVFGNDSWRKAVESDAPFERQSLQIARLYKDQLRSLPKVEYVYAFEMRTAQKKIGKVGYYLLFASQHHRGLEKMKEAMRMLDQTGDYKFSNAMVGQMPLIRFDRPEDHVDALFNHFRGQRVRYAAVRDYALNETPFANPKSMLRILPEPERIRVFSNNPKRRRGTFKEEDIQAIEFREEGGQRG